MRDLTERQHEFLVFVINYRATNGSSPSIQEVATHFSVSKPSAFDVIQCLLEKEYLRASKPGQARNLLPGKRFAEAEL